MIDPLCLADWAKCGRVLVATIERMEISESTIQLLASAELQLTPVLGLALIWTEGQLSGSRRVLDQGAPAATKGQGKNTRQSSRVTGKKDGTMLGIALVTFLHSISWSIVALAVPSKVTISIALTNGLVFLMIATLRIVQSSLPTPKALRIVVLVSVFTVWVPVSQLIAAIATATSPPTPAPRPSITTSTNR